MLASRIVAEALRDWLAAEKSDRGGPKINVDLPRDRSHSRDMKTSRGRTVLVVEVKAELGWIRDLPEIGGDIVARLVGGEAEIIAKRAELLRQVAALEADLTAHRGAAVERVERDWTTDEIRRAVMTNAVEVAS